MKPGFRAGILLAIAVLLAISAPGGVKSNHPTFGDDSLESSPIVATNPPIALQRNPTRSPLRRAAFDVTRVLSGPGRRHRVDFPFASFGQATDSRRRRPPRISAVKILGRCTISPRQNLLVIQFGKRLVLVGDTGANLNPLCEITDPDEVAAILAQARDESISVARRFESLFGRARKDFAEAPTAQPGDQFDDAHDIKPDDPSLEDTQKELSDLREKVRDVARQIGSRINCARRDGSKIFKIKKKIEDSPGRATAFANRMLYIASRYDTMRKDALVRQIVWGVLVILAVLVSPAKTRADVSSADLSSAGPVSPSVQPSPPTIPSPPPNISFPIFPSARIFPRRCRSSCCSRCFPLRRRSC